ncbi:MAG TPA: dienelactone hydrolase family protein [Longimicrobiaceae bacterium]|nr:dienelactone hydrolase family protein [Longimicrobiaceae bacterium]
MTVRARWEIRPPDGSPPIRGDLRAPSGPAPRSAVILCHGFKGFKDWGFFPTLAKAIARRGHAAISFNFSRSGIGQDGRDFSALELFEQNTHSRNVAEIRTVLAAVRGNRLFPEPPQRIGLFGHSRGGGEAILAAAEDGGLNALVTWSAIAAVERWGDVEVNAWQRGDIVHIPNSRTGQQMPVGPGFWRDIKQNSGRLDIIRAAERLALPWLIVHGEDDETVSLTDSEVLFDAAGDNTELLQVEDAGHTFGAVHPYAGTSPALETAMDATLDWFEIHLA